MPWIVRATLPDHPGALAALTQECGKAGVNIVGLQVFPGDGEVTDELVLQAPAGWGPPELRELLERAGGSVVSVLRSADEAVDDQPTRYVRAARSVLAHPASFPDVVAHLFDADVHPAPVEQDVMELLVGDVTVQIRRTTPFTAVERARGAAMAELVGDVLARDRPAFAPSGGRRMGAGTEPELVVQGLRVGVVADGVAVGRAEVAAQDAEPGLRGVDLDVEASWRRRGIGTRLLTAAARVAVAQGAREILLTTRADNQAVMPMLLAAGMRGRIRMAGDTLTVRIAVHELRPLE